MRERTHLHGWRRALVGVAAVAVAAVLVPTPVSAKPAGEHCVVEVTGQEADGRYVTTEPRCYGTYRAMLASIDVFPRSRSEDATVLAGEVASSSVALATHYENFNGLGASITVWGTGCNGGYTNLDSAWRNRISSTYTGCGTVRHFDLLNKGGTWEDIGAPNGNLTGGMNNKAESIQYM